MNIASIYPFPSSVGWYHDVNASILTKKEIFSYEEAKLSENNSDYLSRFPEKSLLMGFKNLGISPKNIDKWVFGKPYGCKVNSVLEYYLNNLFKLEFSQDDFKNRVEFIEHHISHISLGLYTSKFDDCCFISADGGGDWGDNHCLVWGTFNQKKGICILGKQKGKRFSGFASMHDLIGELIGFGFFDNGKTAGLACYGKYSQKIAKVFDELIVEKSSKQLSKYSFDCIYNFKKSDYQLQKVNVENYKRWHVLNTPGQFIKIKEKLNHFNVLDIAKTGQDVLFGRILKFVDQLLKTTKKDKIVLTGGLFQNITLNMLLNQKYGRNNIFVPIASNDSGLSLGAALYVLNKYTKKNHKLIKNSPYLNPSLGIQYESEEIKKILSEYDLNYKKVTDKKLAYFLFKKIISGYVVGWFRGRAELGPRSLGNRSVFADPRNPFSKARVNQLMKKRDWFMPYAPICIAEEAYNWFEEMPLDSPYMSMGFIVKKERAKNIPAAVHIDGSSRPNTLRREFNPVVYDAIKLFFNKTKVPMFLNTSFNRHGIPTIGKIRQAIDHLNSKAIDYLVINNFIVQHKKNRKKINSQVFNEKNYLKMLRVLPAIQLWLKNKPLKKLDTPDTNIISNKKWIQIEGIKIFRHEIDIEKIKIKLVKWFYSKENYN